jgi:hypothetical protein
VGGDEADNTEDRGERRQKTEDRRQSKKIKERGLLNIHQNILRNVLYDLTYRVL